MSTGPVELQGVTINAGILETLQGFNTNRNVLKGITIAVGTGAQIMQLKVVDRNHEPIEGATCRVLNAISGSNNVLSSDGVDDYIRSNLAKTAYGSAFSIEFWIKPIGTVGSKGIFQVASGLSSSSPWILLQRNSTTQVRWYLNGTYRITINVAEDEWCHLALTFDGTVWRSYKNGIAQGTYTGPIGSNAGSYTYFFNGYNGYFKGNMADARIWGVTKSEADILAAMNKRLVGDETNLVEYWKMDEGTGTIINAMVNSSNNGTIYGATWQEADESFPLFDGSIQGYDPTPYDTGTTNANGLTTLNYQINTIHGLEVTLPGKRRFIMPFERTTRGLLDWQVMLSDYLATFATDRGNILINSEPENNDANFLIE